MSGGFLNFWPGPGDNFIDHIGISANTADPAYGCLTCHTPGCHDPHGVPSAGPGSAFNPTFLRKSIAGSNLCLTCHAK